MLSFRGSIALLLLLSMGCTSGGMEPPVFDSRLAFEFLRRQCEFGPRIPGTDGHEACRGLIEEQLAASGAEPFEQRFPIDSDVYGFPVELINIRAEFFPHQRKRILLGAHYDTRPWSDQDPDPARRGDPVPGANDGASGVAVLLAIADLCSRYEFPVGIDLVFFDGEDAGKAGEPRSYCLGSQHFVENREGYEPYGMILLDMVGDADLRIYRETNGALHAPYLTEAIFREAADLGHGTVLTAGVGPMVFDDHVPFLEAGIPAVDLIDFEYEHWHTTEDTVDKCSAASLEVVGEVLTSFLWKGAAFGPGE